MSFRIEILRHQKRLAYQHTFLGGDGKVLPFASEVLADLKRFCGINKGGLVVSPIGRTVDPYATIYRAAQRDVYLRIIQFLELEEESEHAGRANTD